MTEKNRHGFTIRSFCRSCREDFAGDSYFERHRVGVHEYTHAQGLGMDPPRDDGRRCLDADEMTERGWALNGRGQWYDPQKASEAARAFRERSERAS